MTQQSGTHISTRQQYGAYASGEEERVITDEMMDLARSRIGARLPSRDGFNTEATRDAIRHFAQGHGIDNPLYSDPEYAKKTRWGGIIAPPTFCATMGVAVHWDRTPEERERARDAMSGIHSWEAGGTAHFSLPIYPGDMLTVRNFQGDYVEKTNSQFAGRTVLDYNNSEYWNQRGELVARRCGYTIRGGRQRGWGERKKYADIQPQAYTPEDIARIDADYEREEIRGATPRYWEDVEVGEEIVPVVHGPITVTDMLAFAAAHGLLMYRANFSHRLAYQVRKAHPRLFEMNEYGIPDMIEAVHWDNTISQRTGNPLAYDYGPQRVIWLTHAITNWMGDDGWLRTFYHETRRFVYIGDTLWIKGKVTGKEIRNGEAIVELDVWADDQRGRTVMPAHAEVMLPSRELGPVQLPVKFESPPPGWYVT